MKEHETKHAPGENFADSAARAGLLYEQLLQNLLALGLSYDPTSRIQHHRRNSIEAFWRISYVVP